MTETKCPSQLPPHEESPGVPTKPGGGLKPQDRGRGRRPGPEAASQHVLPTAWASSQKRKAGVRVTLMLVVMGACV